MLDLILRLVSLVSVPCAGTKSPVSPAAKCQRTVNEEKTPDMMGDIFFSFKILFLANFFVLSAPTVQQALSKLWRGRGRLLPVPTAFGGDGNGELESTSLSIYQWTDKTKKLYYVCCACGNVFV